MMVIEQNLTQVSGEVENIVEQINTEFSNSELCSAINKRKQLPCQFKRKHGNLCGIHHRFHLRKQMSSNTSPQCTQTENITRNNQKNKYVAHILNKKEIMEWIPGKKITRSSLQKTLREYGIRKKINGKKNELIQLFITKVKHPIVHESQIIRLQRWFRTHIQYIMRFFHGGDPNCMKHKCVNDTEFMTLERMETIPDEEFVCYTTPSGHNYGFTIESVKYLFQHKTKPVNPYTRESLPFNFSDRVNALDSHYSYIQQLAKYTRGRKPLPPQMSRIQMYILPMRVWKWCDHIKTSGWEIKADWILLMSLRKLQTAYLTLDKCWSKMSPSVVKEILPKNRPLFSWKVRRNFYRARNRFEYMQIILSLFQTITSTSPKKYDQERGIIFVCVILYISCRASRESLQWAADIDFENWRAETRHVPPPSTPPIYSPPPSPPPPDNHFQTEIEPPELQI